MSRYIYATSLLLAASSLFATCANAQNVRTAVGNAEPLQMMSSGKLTACGLKLILLELPPGSTLVQVQIYAPMTKEAPLAIRSEQISYSNGISFKPNATPESAWIRFGEEDLLPLSAKRNIGDSFIGYVAAGTATTVSLIRLVEEGSRIQVGLRQIQNGVEQVYSARMEIKASTRDEFRSCMKELISRTVRPDDQR